jgi:hypothetical protein
VSRAFARPAENTLGDTFVKKAELSKRLKPFILRCEREFRRRKHDYFIGECNWLDRPASLLKYKRGGRRWRENIGRIDGYNSPKWLNHYTGAIVITQEEDDLYYEDRYAETFYQKVRDHAIGIHGKPDVVFGDFDRFESTIFDIIDEVYPEFAEAT